MEATHTFTVIGKACPRPIPDPLAIAIGQGHYEFRDVIAVKPEILRQGGNIRLALGHPT